MAPRTHFLARLIGLFLIPMGLALLINRPAILGALAVIVREPALLLTFGMIFTAVGLAMVIGHNRWSGGAATVVVTVIGWVLLMRGLLLLFAPPAVLLEIYDAIAFEQRLPFYVAVVEALGVYLVTAGLSRRGRLGNSPPVS